MKTKYKNNKQITLKSKYLIQMTVTSYYILIMFAFKNHINIFHNIYTILISF